MTFNKSAFIPLILAIFVILSCSGNPAAPPEAQEQQPIENLDPLARAFFTGRDSFGVAFKGKVQHAEISGTEESWTITGGGNATHLGRFSIASQDFTLIEDTGDDDVVIEQTGRDSIAGTFEFIGTRNQTVEGTFAGTREETGDQQYDLEGVFQIDDHDITATKAGNDSGWATMSGKVDLKRNTISYQLDGWLLHFVRQ